MPKKLVLTLVAGLLALTSSAAPNIDSPLRRLLAEKRAAIQALATVATPPVTLKAKVTAESRSGVRRLRIRDFQFLSDSDRSYAGYNLGAGSWDSLVAVLADAVVDEYVVQAAKRGVALDSIDVVFASKPEDPESAKNRKVRYPRNLGYVAHIESDVGDAQLEDLRRAVERESAVLNLVTDAQPIGHAKVTRKASAATRDASLPPGLRDFLVEKRAAILRQQSGAGSGASASGDARAIEAHGRIEPRTGLIEARTGRGNFQFLHDSADNLGGHGLAPTVEEHVLGVVGTCLTHIFEVQAASRQVVLDSLEVEVEGTLTPRFGRGVQTPSRFKDIGFSVELESPATAAEIDALRGAVEASCPLYNLLKDPQPLQGKVVRGRYRPKG